MLIYFFSWAENTALSIKPPSPRKYLKPVSHYYPVLSLTSSNHVAQKLLYHYRWLQVSGLQIPKQLLRHVLKPAVHREWKLDWEVQCQKHVSRVERSNYIPQHLPDVITCPCARYLLLAQHSSYNARGTLSDSFTFCMKISSHIHLCHASCCPYRQAWYEIMSSSEWWIFFAVMGLR